MLTSKLPSVDMGSPDDGNCAILPTSTTDLLARASARNVTEAARAIIRECVIRRRVGGLAAYIGRVDHKRHWTANRFQWYAFLEKATCKPSLVSS